MVDPEATLKVNPLRMAELAIAEPGETARFAVPDVRSIPSVMPTPQEAWVPMRIPSRPPPAEVVTTRRTPRSVRSWLAVLLLAVLVVAAGLAVIAVGGRFLVAS